MLTETMMSSWPFVALFFVLHNTAACRIWFSVHTSLCKCLQ